MAKRIRSFRFPQETYEQLARIAVYLDLERPDGAPHSQTDAARFAVSFTLADLAAKTGYGRRKKEQSGRA